MRKWTTVVLTLFAAVALGASDHPTVAASPVAKAAAKCAATVTPGTAVAAATPCADCPKECESQVNSCKNGSVKACYLAAACLCQCNLDAGGCGSDKEALRKCVTDNKKNASDLER